MAEIDNRYPESYYQEMSGFYDGKLLEEVKTKEPRPMELNKDPIVDGAIEEDIPDSVTIDVIEIKFGTDRAWLLNTEAGEAWFPKSKCSLDERLMCVTLPQWLYTKKF